MKGKLLLSAESLAIIAAILIFGGGFFYWGYGFIDSEEGPLKENANALECSQKDIELVSYSSNETFFTAYLDLNSDAVVEVVGDANRTVRVSESSQVQRIDVRTSDVRSVRAEFPECGITLDLM